jgi:hypothetical protein
MQTLASTIKSQMAQIIGDFNEVRLPALEQAWGRTVAEQRQFWDHDQISVEYSKNFSIPLNNCFFRAINTKLPKFIEKTTRGSDYVYDIEPIEDKNAFNGTGQSWTGNGFGKCNWHLLKRFEVDPVTGKIVRCFAMLVDLSKTQGAWGQKTVNGKTAQRVGLKFLVGDIDNIIVIHGTVVKKKKYLEFKVEPV